MSPTNCIGRACAKSETTLCRPNLYRQAADRHRSLWLSRPSDL